ncbi:choice-of-anchor J domain-containing protein [Flavobacterium sp.]|uniref:T9SS-dependent choice-of-anchor J family protein n=1 Tax=Flavobacterium sp. TaxID=239 RepID=UPI00261D38C2|nr:choice-of-anchor J domain-containing protein [Flavobacterium sp.]
MKQLFLVFAFVCLSAINMHANTKMSAAVDDFDITVTLDGKVTVIKPYGAYRWDVEYGPSGFVTGSGTYQGQIIYGSVTIALNPFIIYDFRVRPRNMFGTPGNWSNPISINTCSQTEQTVGYNFNFDTSALDGCWRGYKSTTSSYEPLNQTDYEYYGNSGQSMMMSADFFDGYYAFLVSPRFSDISTDKKISFWVKHYSAGSMKVGTITNPFDAGTFHQLQVVQGNSGAWQKVTVYLNNYNDVDQYFMIQFKGGYQSSDYAYIDDFSYEEALSCNDLSNVSFTNVQEHTVDLSFNAPSGQNLWEINIKNLLTTEISTVTTTQTNFTLDNLIGNTGYDIKVRAVCGSDQFSNWSPISSIHTICQDLTAGYSTSFYDASILDPCWKAIIPQSTSVSAIGNYINGSEVVLSPRTGSKMIEISSWSGIGPDYLITPYFSDLDANKMIRFYMTTRISDSDLISLKIGTMTNPADPTTFHLIESMTNADMSKSGDNLPSWKEHTVYLNNYNAAYNDHYIAFRFMPESMYATETIFMDDFSYDNIPLCTTPIYPKAVDTDYDSASLGWQTYLNATSTEWQIEYGPEGFEPGTGTLVNANTNPYKIENLTIDDANYDFYVRSKCGTDYSEWSVKGSFRTKCIGVAVGYTDNFESYPVGSFDSCWNSLMPFYPVGTDQYPDFVSIVNTGSPNYYPAHSGTRSVRYMNNESTPVVNESEKTMFVTPRLIDFDHFKNISIWIYAKASSYENPEQIIFGTLSDPDDYTTFTPFQTITNAVQFENQWKKYTIDFSSYTGTDKYVGIRQGQANQETLLFLDDFEYGGTSCTTPTNLTAEQSGSNSVSVGWNTNMPETPSSWTVEYGPSGFTSGTIVSATTNPFELQGLNLYASYEFRVRNNCEESVTGNYSDRYAFKVTCAVNAPFEDNFDQYPVGNPIPSNFCWTTNDYLRSRLTSYCLDGANSCPNAVRINSHHDSNFEPESHGAMVSPYLSDFGSDKSISFWLNRSPSGLNQTGYQPVIIVGTISNPLDFSTFVPYQNVDLTDLPANGKVFTVDFSGYTGSAKHIVFMHDGVFEYDYLFIDNFKYFQTDNACSAPINILAESINSNSAHIIWDTVSTSDTYTMEYGLQGFVPGSGTAVTVNSNYADVTGLIPNTSYDYYLHANCGTQNSIVQGPYHFFTTCDALAVPWEENFDNMAAYGAQLLPDCFRTTSGEFESRNQSIENYNIDFDHLLTGVGDTHYLFMNGFVNNFFTPLLTLQAGTTYCFSVMARKGYEYAGANITARTGRGNTIAAMNIGLTNLGTLTEYHYNKQPFYFTPLVSGDYSFLLGANSSGGTSKILDKFKVVEGYNETISSNEEGFDFDGPTSNKIILESTVTSEIDVVSDQQNNYLRMAGSTAETWNEGDSWLANEESITKVNMKINAQSMTMLYLIFDLKQAYAENNQYSAFRVMVNGIVLGDILHPNSSESDPFTTKIYDLSAFTGGDIHISLQHLGRSANGDFAYLDNVMFANSPLSIPEMQNFSTMQVYPNPAKDFVTIKGAPVDSIIEMFNISGQLLYSTVNAMQETKISLNAFESGVYFIKVSTGNKNRTYKVIKN